MTLPTFWVLSSHIRLVVAKLDSATLEAIPGSVGMGQFCYPPPGSAPGKHGLRGRPLCMQSDSNCPISCAPVVSSLKGRLEGAPPCPPCAPFPDD